MSVGAPPRPAQRVVVAGGGISGLSAARELTRRGAQVVVLERSQRWGGPVESVRRDGWLFESGPNTLMIDDAELGGLIDALIPTDEQLVAKPDAARRYIVRGGRPRAIPRSPGEWLSARLWSWGGLLRAAGGALLPRAADERSLGAFARRRLGPELTDYAVNPFVAGIYAGDPDRLELASAFPKLDALRAEADGSLLRGGLALARKGRQARRGAPRFRRKLASFARGIGQLIEALLAQLAPAAELRLGCALRGLERAPDGWRCALEDGSSLEADGVVLALPAAGLDSLALGDGVRGGLGDLREVHYPPVSVVALGFPRDAVRHPLDGFGMLLPARERGQILGTLFSSTLFPGRAPAGQVLLSTFVGGSRQPELTELDDDALSHLVAGELERLLGASGPPSARQIKRWPRAIPQLDLGHAARVRRLDGFERDNPGLVICGALRDGVALPRCLRGGLRAAARL